MTAAVGKSAPTGEDVTILSEVEYEGQKYSVTTISGNAFAGDKVMKHIVIPKSVKTIADATVPTGYTSAFARSVLETVTFEQGSELEYIGNYAFYACEKLSSINLPEGLKTIGKGAFGAYWSTVSVKVTLADGSSANSKYIQATYSLKSLHLPSTLESIGDDAFSPVVMNITIADGNEHYSVSGGMLLDKEQTRLIRAFNPSGDVDIPDTVKTVDRKAFFFITERMFTEVVNYSGGYFNTSGANVGAEIQEGSYTYQIKGFDDCPVTDPAAVRISIPEGTETIGDGAFHSVDWAEYISIPSTVTSIGNNAFSYCPSLKEITVGEGLKLGTNALGGSELDTVTFVSDEPSKPSGWSNVTAKKIVLSPDTVSVGTISISGVTTVTYGDVEAEEGTAKFPSSVEVIGGGALTGTSIKKLVVPSSVTQIGANAFGKCEDLAEVVFEGELPEIGAGAFDGCTECLNARTDGLVCLNATSGAQTVTIVVGFEAPDGWNGTISIGSDVDVFLSSSIASNVGLKNITVEDNDSFTVVNGVLYDAGMTQILAVSDAVSGSVRIPDNMTRIEAGMFSNAVTNGFCLAFGNHEWMYIGENAFVGTSIEGAFVAPGCAITISNSAFAGTNITSADFTNVPSGEKISIGSRAFSGSQLESLLILPDSDVTYRSNCFDQTQLDEFVMYSGNADYVFSEKDKPIYVHGGKYGLNNTSADNVHVYGGGSVTTSTNGYVIDLWIHDSNCSVSLSERNINRTTVHLDNSLAGVYDLSQFEGCKSISWFIECDGKLIEIPDYEGLVFDHTTYVGMVSLKPILSDGYDRSEISIYADGVEVTASGGEYRVSADSSVADSIQISVQGLELNTYDVSFDPSTPYDVELIDDSTVHGSSYVFSVSESEFASGDIYAVVGGSIYYPVGNVFTIPVYDDMVIELLGASTREYTIILMDGSVVLERYNVKYGTELDLSGIPDASGSIVDTWYSGTGPVGTSLKVTESMVLFASESDAGYETVRVEFDTVRGWIEAETYSGGLQSGDEVRKGAVVKLTMQPAGVYDTVAWYVNGVLVDSPGALEVSADSDLYIVPVARYYQSGYESIVNAPMPLSKEELEHLLDIGESHSSSGDMEEDLRFMPKGQVSVGNTLYLSIGSKVYKIDIGHGISEDILSSAVSFDVGTGEAGKLCYAGGYIFEASSNAIFDLDLNLVGHSNIGFDNVEAYEGDFIGTNISSFVRFEMDDGASNPYAVIWIADTSDRFSAWSPGESQYVIADGYAYYLTAEDNGNGTGRGMASLNLESGEKADTVDLTPYIRGHRWDDGWITYSDERVYVATYTCTLFSGGQPSGDMDDEVSKLVGVDVDGGMFGEVTLMDVDQGHKSGLIEFNGRGYLYAGVKDQTATLYVFDMDTMEVIYTASGPFTHGGMVINTYYATEENGWTVYGYVIGYDSSKIFFFSDREGQTEAVSETWTGFNNSYSTRYMTTTEDGHLIWYNDTSVRFVYGKAYALVSISDGTSLTLSKVEYGSAVDLPEPAEREGMVFVGWCDADGGIVGWDLVADGDIFLTAVWMPDNPSVSFEVDGEIVHEAVVNDGDTVSIPPVPEKESDAKYDYRFLYWTSNGVEYDFSEPVTEDIVLTAVFQPVLRDVGVVDSGIVVDASDKEQVEFAVGAEAEGSVQVNLGIGAVDVDDASAVAGKTLNVGIDAKDNIYGVAGNAYEITVTADGTEYRGGMSITLPYSPSDGKVPVIYYCVGDAVQRMDVESYDDTSVTFATDHNSVYVVGSEDASASSSSDTSTPGESGTDLAIIAIFCGAGVAAGIMLAYFGMLLFRTKTD